MPGYTIGLDVGGTKIMALALNPETGEQLHVIKAPTPQAGEGMIAALTALFGDLTQRIAELPSAVGVGIAGLVDNTGVLRTSPHLSALVDVNVHAELAAAVNVPVFVENDATAALCGEMHFGAAKGLDDALMVAIGTGIGGGLVLRGELQRGAHGFAGEFGHMMIDPNGQDCPCGERGCWEQVASGSALGRMAKAAMADQKLSSLNYSGEAASFSSEALVAAAQQGNAEAAEVVESYSRWVSYGIVNLINALDPQTVLIGGGLVEAGDLLLNPIRQYVGSHIIGADVRPPVEVVPARLGPEAAAIGAAMLFDEQYSRS